MARDGKRGRRKETEPGPAAPPPRPGLPRGWKIGILIALAVLVFWLAYLLRAIFIPVLVALLIAYVIHPVITILERRRVPRMATIAGIYLVLTAVICLGLFWLLPAAYTQGRDFVEEVFAKENPKILEVRLWGGKNVGDLVGHNWKEIGENIKAIWGDITPEKKEELTQTGGKFLGGVVAATTRSIGALFAAVTFVILVPVYLFFFLRNMDPWWRRFKELIPTPYRDRTIGTLGRIHTANMKFFRGQMMISLIEGGILALGLLVLGVDFWFLFGLLYAVMSVIPFVGPVVGFTVTELFVLSSTGEFGWVFFLAAGLFLLIQAVESLVLQPVILGKETGLHPIAIILALFIAGDLFGFFGMLLAIPIASTVMILFQDYVQPMIREVTGDDVLTKT